MTDFDTFGSPYHVISNFNPILGSNLAMYPSLLYHPLASINSRLEARRSTLQWLYAHRNPFWQRLFDGTTLSRVNNPFDIPNYLIHIPESFSVRSNEFSVPDLDRNEN
jgi:hypothetical protein